MALYLKIFYNDCNTFSLYHASSDNRNIEIYYNMSIGKNYNLLIKEVSMTFFLTGLIVHYRGGGSLDIYPHFQFF